MSSRIALIIPAAGIGRRMKTKTRKPFLALGGKPILHHTLERFRAIPGIVQIILAVNAADYRRGRGRLAKWSPLGVTDIVKGGATRTESVANALAALGPEAEIILIHDAVRPFVRTDVIRGVIAAAAKYGAAIAAERSRDTAKRVEEGLITATIPRDGLFLAQTPQGFRREVIVEAYRRCKKREFTDDACVVEAAGGRVAVVESTYDNIKITTPEDMAFARAVMAAAAPQVRRSVQSLESSQRRRFAGGSQSEV